MKALYKIGLLFIIFNMWTMIQPQQAAAQVSLQVFYDDLGPYGSWISNPTYGYVWVPRVSGFIPYRSNGHWVYTDWGWTWVSGYSWGWAPFHYGRWYYDSFYGWVWVPDTDWGPGWVSWRQSNDYYGWAPIGPGISIGVAYSSGYSVPYNYWTFVRNRDFGRTNLSNYYVSNTRNTTIINNTTVINNTRRNATRNVTYNTGPDRNQVQKATGSTFTPIAIKDRAQPGQRVSKNQLEIYRPQMQRKTTRGAKPVPSKVTERKDLKPQAERPQRTEPATRKPIDQRQDSRQPQIQQSREKQQNRQPQQRQPQVQPVPQKREPIREQSEQRIPQTNRQAVPQMPQRPNQPPGQVQQDRLQQNNQPTPQMRPQQNNYRPDMPRIQPQPRMQPERSNNQPRGNQRGRN
jgi:hypothetical protein